MFRLVEGGTNRGRADIVCCSQPGNSAVMPERLWEFGSCKGASGITIGGEEIWKKERSFYKKN